MSNSTTQDAPTSNPGSNSNQKLIKYGIIGVVGLGVLAMLLTFFVIIPQSVISQGNQQESNLSTSYANGANTLSNCVKKSRDAASVASENAARFDQVIKDAVAGTNAAGHVDLSSPTSRGALLPILVQAYPDLKGQTDLFNRVVNIITGCQDDFRNQQTVVQDKVRQFNTWKTGSWKVRSFGGDKFPNENMYVRLPGINVTGQAAYERISRPIVDSVTSAAYNTGEQSLDTPFGTPTPTTK